MIIKIIISIGLLFLLAFTLSAQTKTTPSLTRKNTRINDKKPSTYIDFVKIEKRVVTITVGCTSSACTPTTKTEEFDAVLLKLHNNSIWTIQLAIDFVDPNRRFEFRPLPGRKTPQFMALDNIELNLEYGVELINSEVPLTTELKRKLPYVNLAAMMMRIWLPPDRGVVFAVRREELQKNLRIFVPFRYEWEIPEKNSDYEDPEHRVHFNWSQLVKATGL